MKLKTNAIVTLILTIALVGASLQAQSSDPKAWIRNGDIAWQQGNTVAAIVNYNYAFNNLGWDWASALTLSQRYLALGQEAQALNAYRFGVQLAWNWAIDPNTLQLRPQAQSVASGEQGLTAAINQWNNTLRTMRMSSSTQQWFLSAANSAYTSYQLLQQKKSGHAANTPQPSTPPTRNAGTLITWGTQAKELGGKEGQQFTLTCPANGEYSGRLWGTDYYTDDSSICTAAVHSGLITKASGGTVRIELRAGASSYQGTTRNGLSSSNYGSWGGTFIFIR